MWNWDTTWGLLKRVFKGKWTSWRIISLIHCFANTQSNIVGKKKWYSRHVHMDCLQTFISFKTLFCSCWKLLFPLAKWAGFHSSLPPQLNFLPIPKGDVQTNGSFHLWSTCSVHIFPFLYLHSQSLWQLFKSWVSAVTPFPHCNWRW